MTHAQKLGISYSDEEDNFREHHGESAVESSIQDQSSSIILISHPVASQHDEALESGSGSQDHANIVVTSDSDSTSRDNTVGSLGANTEELMEHIEGTSGQDKR